MLIEQIIKFELRGPGPVAVHVLLQLIIFMTKQKSFQKNLRVDHYLLLKYCRRQCTLLIPTRAKLLTKFNHKMQDFKGGESSSQFRWFTIAKIEV